MLDRSEAACPSEHGEHQDAQKAGLLNQTTGGDANEPDAHLNSLEAEVLQGRPRAAAQRHTQTQHRQRVALLVGQLVGKGARLHRRVTVGEATLLAVAAQVKGLVKLVTQGLGAAQLLDSVAPKEPVVNKGHRGESLGGPRLHHRRPQRHHGRSQHRAQRTALRQAPADSVPPVPQHAVLREDPPVLLVVALHKLPDTSRAPKVPKNHHKVREPHGVEELGEVLLQVKARAAERLEQAEVRVLEAAVGDATQHSPGSPALNPRGQLLHQNPSTDAPGNREDGQGTVALGRFLDEDHTALPPPLRHSAGHKHALPEPSQGTPKASREQHPRGAGPIVGPLRFVKHALNSRFTLLIEQIWLQRRSWFRILVKTECCK